MRKKNTNKIRVKALSQPRSILNFCAQNFPKLGSKTSTKKAIEAGQVFLNDQLANASDLVKNGDFIKVDFQISSNSKTKNRPKINIEIPIVFEDNFLIIVNKPGGIAVNGNRNKTVENVVANIAQKSREIDLLPSPVSAHRLDVPTKGLVILAKTRKALIQLNKAFQKGQIEKIYYAVTHGKTPEFGEIDAPIQDKKSITKFETIRTAPSRKFGHFSLLNLKPITGRTHQLRIHLNDLGHLIVGDKLYAKGQKTILGKGLFLCAGKLKFKHPVKGTKVEVKLPIPNRFLRLLENERKRF